MDLVEKFDAKGKTGAPYHVEVYQIRLDEANEASAVDQRSYKLADGRALDPLSNEKFRIVQTGEKIYRV
ncbi:hypothetical protein [Herbaspirillum robiniae]|uniref:Uncharacterized protein n=1 Tax=Herbaspirillum robiniae TaxID=2014887 RepID=A0A246WUG3_9BURK|nr:hypothetical protein [Herbaspirillum robiniae]NUU01288.1 hypothetical protein [Herbaspirillum robiniae]OWY30687.1 hypothetical protein CEJ42_01000 [Herbaspirillum robiniae]